MQESDSKYLAFISYSRSDNDQDGRRWADWIKDLIEKFPIPINCQPTVDDHATSPAKTREVFLDRSKLAAGGELMVKLESHLAQAEYLVVICSPRSAASDYVRFEIDFFRNSGRVDRIIPIVVDGNNAGTAPGTCWIPDGLRDLIHVKTPDPGGEKPKGNSLIYADFRVREKLPNHTVLEEEGWTDPLLYEKHLRSKNLYSDTVLSKYQAVYRQAHSVAKFALLGAVFGLEPGQLQGESLIEENQRKQEVIRRNRRNMLVLGLFAAAMAAMAAITYRFYQKAETERAKSERSLQMIGDAHEVTNRLIADLFIDLRSKLEPLGQDAALADARRRVEEHFDDIDPEGNDDDSLHMRSVVLDSRGYLALKDGNLAVALDCYTRSFEIRKELLERNGPKALHMHDLSISHDNLGDWHIAKAQELGAHGLDPQMEYDTAIDEYREGLAKAKVLAARPDATLQWSHDVAVSYLKVSGALQLAGDVDEALRVLEEGLAVAEKVAASDSIYAKWQAQLGVYYLSLGELCDMSDKPAEARSYLLKGQDIFSHLEDRKLLNRQYTAWQRQIDEDLNALTGENGKENR